MCYASYEPKYMMRDIEERLGAREARGGEVEAPSRGGLWAAFVRLAARLAHRRVAPVAEQQG